MAKHTMRILPPDDPIFRSGVRVHSVKSLADLQQLAEANARHRVSRKEKIKRISATGNKLVDLFVAAADETICKKEGLWGFAEAAPELDSDVCACLDEVSREGGHIAYLYRLQHGRIAPPYIAVLTNEFGSLMSRLGPSSTKDDLRQLVAEAPKHRHFTVL
jgi:hypothetical protein